MIEWVVSLCDLTGHMVEPWVENGYHALLIDPQHKIGVHRDGRIVRVGQTIDHTHMVNTARHHQE